MSCQVYFRLFQYDLTLSVFQETSCLKLHCILISPASNLPGAYRLIFRLFQCPYLWCKKNCPLPTLFDHDPSHRFIPVSSQGKLTSNIKVREDHFDFHKCTYSYWIPYQVPSFFRSQMLYRSTDQFTATFTVNDAFLAKMRKINLVCIFGT